jgi:hypothetical protein
MRHLERRQTLAPWPVTDIQTGEAVGEVADLTEEGLQLKCGRRFEKGQELAIQIAVDEKLARTDSISLVVKNAWCRAGKTDGRFSAGFAIVDISPKDKRNLHTLIDTFSYLA